MKRDQAIADRQFAQSMPFLLGFEVELLATQLMGKLAFQILKQLVPSHAQTLVSVGQQGVGLSTADTLPMDRQPDYCFSVPTAEAYATESNERFGESMGKVLPMDGETERSRNPLPLIGETLPSKIIRARFSPDEFFGHQPTPTSSLPSPKPLIENLTRCVVEILAGARELDQISRWVTDEVYRHLLKRVVLSARARQATGRSATRPNFSIGLSTMCEPRDGVVEAVVIVRGRARTRAVALRLEGLDNRWRATAINVL
jgi:hypothetical protein